jgi:hypothetical protein
MNMRHSFFILLGIISFNYLISQVTISSNFPASLGLNAAVDVDVKINKGAIANFAKYQMDVPAGITVSEGDSKGGNFTFENNRAKIVWVSIPADAEFIVKFKVKVTAGTATDGSVTQKFYYLENGAKKEVETDPLAVKIGGGTTAAVKTEPVKKEEPVKKAEPVTVAKTEPIKKEEPVVTKTEPVKKEEPKAATPSADGLVFKIQLAASPTDPGKSKYAALGNACSISKEDGMYKVLYGNYATKEEALKAREEIATKGFTGFLVKYQNGVRVK